MNFVQEQIERKIPVSHGDDRVDGIGIAAANQVSQLLIDHLDNFAVVVFGRELFQFFRNQVADATQLFVAKRIRRMVPSKIISPPSNMAPSETRTTE